MLSTFPPKRDYHALSVRDLLEARDAYHYHLTHLPNVLATAIGLYRIKVDDWYARNPPDRKPPANYTRPAGPRRLDNSITRPWSWPCVLVFVDQWRDRKAFGSDPDHMVPRALYLPDGRVVPTCVIEAQPGNRPQHLASVTDFMFPRSFVGGGCALSTMVQGSEHIGSVGCLVSDGRLTYALTNEHVAGEPGSSIAAYQRGKRVPVGRGAKLSLRKKKFSEVYAGWKSTFGMANIDAGLVEVDDLARWSTQIAGFGNVDEPVDLTTDTLTLELIDCNVRAYGGASGLLFGKIAALFYQYKSTGGFDYIADFLVAPRDPKDDDRRVPFASNPAAMRSTLPGDSGTLWLLEQKRTDDRGNILGDAPPLLRPFALQWGGHVIVDSQQEKEIRAYALATNLSTILRELDLDLVRSWNNDLPNYWGDLGHYTIAAKAIGVVKDAGLRQFLTTNLLNISYSDNDIKPSTFKGLSTHTFVPLADVPDLVWKMRSKGPGRRPNVERPNHFTDMDKPDSNNKTLLDLLAGPDGKTDPARVTTATFAAYYDDPAVADKSKGTLPFRVWQLFQNASKTTRADEFLAIAGVMAHYVGDACQPLHCSYLFDGYPDGRGNGVHAAYEADALNLHYATILPALDKALAQPAPALPSVTDGRGAATAAIELIRRSFTTIAPKTIVDAYIAHPDPTSLFQTFGDDTVKVLADGCRVLAHLWDAAWAARTRSVPAKAIDTAVLSAFYDNTSWCQSYTLATIDAALSGGAPPAAPGAPNVPAGPAAPGRRKGPRRPAPPAKRPPRKRAAVPKRAARKAPRGKKR